MQLAAHFVDTDHRHDPVMGHLGHCRTERQHERANVDDTAVVQRMRHFNRQPNAIDLGAIGATAVEQHELSVAQFNDRVLR